jgi:hypothetical protein
MTPSDYEIIDTHTEWGWKYVRVKHNFIVKMPEQAHMQSWEALSQTWSKDRKGLYLNNSKVYSKMYDQIDFPTLKVLEVELKPYNEGPDNHGFEEENIYFVDKNHVYVNSYMCEFSIVSGANPNTFQVTDVAKGFGTDGDRDFWYSDVLPYRLRDAETINDQYVRVNNRIYCGYLTQVECDTDTFEIIHPRVSNIARDKNHVFFKNDIIEGADAATFQFLEACVAQDRPYYSDGDIDFYATDNKRAYFVSTPFLIKPINTKSLANFHFKIIDDEGFAFDDQYVYTRGRRKKRNLL